MGSKWETPSVPVLAVGCLVLAAVALLALRSTGQPGNELSEALDRTLDAGWSYEAVSHFEPADAAPVERRYGGESPPGMSLDEVIDERAVLINLYSLADVTRVGAETIDGETTTHYAATADPDLQAERLAERTEELGITLPDIREIQDRPMEFEVWIDPSGLLRRFFVSESYRDGSLLASTTIDFYP